MLVHVVIEMITMWNFLLVLWFCSTDSLTHYAQFCDSKLLPSSFSVGTSLVILADLKFLVPRSVCVVKMCCLLFCECLRIRNDTKYYVLGRCWLASSVLIHVLDWILQFIPVSAVELAIFWVSSTVMRLLSLFPFCLRVESWMCHGIISSVFL